MMLMDASLMKSAESLSSSNAFTMSSLGTPCWIAVSTLSVHILMALETDVNSEKETLTTFF